MSMPDGAEYSAFYSPSIGLLYVFNLIVGTGALALPKAFQTAGYVLSILMLIISCIVSYISATFIVESLSVGNAVNAWKRKEGVQITEFDDVVVTESGPSSFEIRDKVEVGQMASMFLGRAGVIFSYLALSIYLFGDLAIYSTTVPKSLMNIICASVNVSTLLPSDNCRDNWPPFFNRFTVYRLCVILFITVCTPLTLIGITKTKYLQLATTISRWSAFILMIFLASAQMTTNGIVTPPTVNVHGFGSLFGVAVYAFMCHHSLPSLVTPMRSKSRIFAKLSGVYLLVISFYFTLSLTGAFAFAHVQDVYTLNFLHDDLTSLFYLICDHFLALFPVFTLTTNYPIVGTTLINNVRVLRDMIMPPTGSHTPEDVDVTEEGDFDEPRIVLVFSEEESLLQDGDEHDVRIRRNARYNCMYDGLIPVAVIILPTAVSLLTDDVLLLASVTGCYPGVAVQSLIPCLLVLSARKYAKNVLNFPVPKKHASYFQSNNWAYAVFAWAIFAVIIVTLNSLGFGF